MKTSIDIEQLLVWAYREELPKEANPVPSLSLAAAAGWAGVSRYGELLTVIDGADVRNRWGVTPDRTAQCAPHADAIAVAEAVADLDGLVIEAPVGWWPFGDMASPDAWGDVGQQVVRDALDRMCVPAAMGALRFKASPSWLVRKYAMVGGVPDWEAEAPEYRMVRGGNGKAKWFVMRSVPQIVGGEVVAYADCEQDGWSPTRRRPVKGAYNKWELVPSPFYAAVDRAEYEVWHSGLVVLADALRDSLERYRVTGPARPARPWESGNAGGSRVLPVLHRSGEKGA
ncbi:hypothetical protein J2X65_001661 [Ancylobacter sp. 3268]|uniref:hypothetical protein n=1 Tax=Ancylobacter sp. 3268 TaxID=2817752 RepID=UPI00285744D8|nr:hypothetical protein [Ancylobacter sp. 3268]MDR6952306.1 hypothetical protein [Ancylobacter sp. 3268]